MFSGRSIVENTIASLIIIKRFRIAITIRTDALPAHHFAWNLVHTGSVSVGLNEFLSKNNRLIRGNIPEPIKQHQGAKGN